MPFTPILLKPYHNKPQSKMLTDILRRSVISGVCVYKYALHATTRVANILAADSDTEILDYTQCKDIKNTPSDRKTLTKTMFITIQGV